MNEYVAENHGPRVVLAGLGINLALGILYTWSVISEGVPTNWGWTQADKSWPFSVACLVFCLVMVPAGRMQDRVGPRWVATIGGVLVGLGMILASFSTDPRGYILGFGVLTGAGIGFGYASATPPAVKWFPAAKTGMIAGIVVSGFGLASVYIAPLTKWLIGSFGLATSIMALGIAFFVVVVGLAQLLKPPPPGYVPTGTVPRAAASGAQTKLHYRPGEMLRTWQFYVLWFMYACGAGAGLMIISVLVKIVKQQTGPEQAFIMVSVLALGNGAGRIVAGMASDKIGRQATLCLCFVIQAVLVFLVSRTTPGSPLASIAALATISLLIGANYGANLSLFPSIAKDYYGLKHFGINYGLLFTAWGLGGFALALLAGKVYDAVQSFNFAYYCSAALLVVAAAATFLLKAPQQAEEEASSLGPAAQSVS